MYPNNNCTDCSNCPDPITPLPLPNVYGQCGDTYDLDCVIYTGPDNDCLGITSGMPVTEVFSILQSEMQLCDCCSAVPQNCVLSDWGPWGECTACTYDENNVATCVRSRRKTVITPASNGGIECGPQVETGTVTLQPVCFTFGSDICESAPDGTQVIGRAKCSYNNKPYYEFTVCGANQVIWFNSTDNLWYLTDTLGVGDSESTVLNNNGGDYPVSNTTTQIWQNRLDKGSINILQSSLTTCPEYKICFHTHITLEGRTYDFYNYMAPGHTETESNNHPVYLYYITIGSVTYTINVYFDILTLKWEGKINSGSGDPTISTLSDTGLYPVGTWTPDPTDQTNYMVASTLGEPCTQPANVNCVLGDWSAWGPCIGGYETRTRSIVTPASGNGTPCGPLTETRTCAAAVCASPTAVTATVSGTSVIVSFTPAVGASTYNVSYTTNGGASYTTVNSTASPITITANLACATTYSGWIVTNCLNGVVSSQVPFSITTPACVPALLCAGTTTNIISGNFNSPQLNVLKIDNTTAQINGSNPVVTTQVSAESNTRFWTNELSNDGLFLAGSPLFFTDALGMHYSGGVIKLKCTSPSTSFFGEINPTFVSVDPTNAGFQVSISSSDNQPVIRAIKYDKINNRLYVGGHFDKYKNANCSHNLVCLNATTGDIIPNTSFKIGIAGIYHSTLTSNTNGGVYDIQIDGNGKIIVGGTFDTYTNTSNVPTQIRNIVRLNFDGTIDNTFSVSATSFSANQSLNPPFQSNLSSVVKTIYVDPNNNYFVGGGFYQYKGTTANHIVKILNNGNIDPAFNSGTGFANTAALPSDSGVQHRGWRKVLSSLENMCYVNNVSGITIEKIITHTTGLLVTGNFNMYNGTTANALVKINTDGTIFSGFTVDTTAFNPSNTSTILRSGMDIKALYDNRILFGGALSNYLGTSNTKSYYILNSNGTINTSANLTGATNVTPFVKTISSNFM